MSLRLKDKSVKASEVVFKGNPHFYSTTFFMAVMAARSSAPQISIE